METYSKVSKMIYVYIGLVVCLFTVNAFVQKLISFKKASFNLIYVPGLTCTFLTMVFFFINLFTCTKAVWKTMLSFSSLILHLPCPISQFIDPKSYPFILLFNIVVF